MESDGYIKLFEKTLSSSSFQGDLSDKYQRTVDSLLKSLRDGSLQPPSWTEIAKGHRLKESEAQEYLQYLLRKGLVVKLVDEELYLASHSFEQARTKIVNFLKENKEISVGQTRDLLNTSRKYALPLLETFDRERLTRRVGDNRVLI
ncbi:hypothetical protein N752_26695 [Desulforamulus aquiferis]|nr:SelB C-terminal domain-containing protein [Desulforamulus aquiferis]RYD02043.1 hypothetical protein N752_26695 [Desulforamulus aquiferis]